MRSSRGNLIVVSALAVLGVLTIWTIADHSVAADTAAGAVQVATLPARLPVLNQTPVDPGALGFEELNHNPWCG